MDAENVAICSRRRFYCSLFYEYRGMVIVFPENIQMPYPKTDDLSKVRLYRHASGAYSIHSHAKANLWGSPVFL